MSNRTLNKLISGVTLACAMVLGATAAQAQYREPYGGPGRPDERRSQDFPFANVQHDLDRAMSAPYLSRHDRDRIEHARKELWDFQQRWSGGRYSKHELDEAIESVHHVVDSRGLEFRDREILQNDLYRMRDFRSTRDSRRYDGYR